MVFEQRQDQQVSDILKGVSEISIYETYLGKIRSIMSSPFREDTKPSFSIFKGNDGRIRWKDFGLGESGDVIDFIQKIENCSKGKAIEILKMMSFSAIARPTHNSSSFLNENMNLQNLNLAYNDVSIDQAALQYWLKFKLTTETLDKYQIKVLYSIRDGKKTLWSRQINHCYGWKISNNWKFYIPENKGIRFFGNVKANQWDGLTHLPVSGQTVFITSSRKDIMVLHQAGFHAVSPQSESRLFPEIIIDELKQRFSRLIVLFDNDKTGHEWVVKNKEQYPFLSSLFMPEGHKDPSDWIAKGGWTIEQLNEYCSKI